MIYLMGENTNGSKKIHEYNLRRGIGRCYRLMTIDPYLGEPFCLDNGAFAAWNQNDRKLDTDYTEVFEFFESRLAHVGELAREGRVPLFIVAPDKPGDGAASLQVTLEWLDRWETEIRPEVDPTNLLPVYFVLQDGQTPEGLEASGVLARVDGLFIGGTDEFKAQENVEMWRRVATAHGLKLHYGRCTQTRLAPAVAAGCDSADSSHPLRLAGRRWARFLEVFDREVLGDDHHAARATQVHAETFYSIHRS